MQIRQTIVEITHRVVMLGLIIAVTIAAVKKDITYFEFALLIMLVMIENTLDNINNSIRCKITNQV